MKSMGHVMRHVTGRKFAHITGNHHWASLSQKQVLNKYIYIKNCLDSDVDWELAPKFPIAKVVVLHNNNKNFIYYNLNFSSFPVMKHCYLYDHPCESQILTQFDKSQDGVLQKPILYLSDVYSSYKRRWAYDVDMVKLQSNEDEAQILDYVATHTEPVMV